MPRLLALSRILASAALLACASLPFIAAGCAKKVVELTVIPATPLPDLHTVGLAQKWERQVPLDPGESIKNAWRVGTSVYVATSYSRLARIEAQSGVLDWSQGLGQENFDIFRPIELRNPGGGPAKQVLVVTRGQTFIIDMLSGAVVKPANLGISVSADPVVIGNTLCIASAGRFYGIYLDRLQGHAWQITQPGDLFESTPATTEDSVIFASRTGRLWRINAETGNWVWKDRQTNGPVVAGLAADPRAVYVPALDQRVYAFSADSGGELWETTEPLGTLETTPRLATSLVLITSNEKGLFGLNRRDGAIKWNVPDINQVATVIGTTAWVGGRDGTLKSISLDTGAVLTSTPTEGIQFYLKDTLDSNVFLVTRAGLVGSYASKQAP